MEFNKPSLEVSDDRQAHWSIPRDRTGDPGKVSGGHVEIGGRPEGRFRFSEARGVSFCVLVRSVFRCSVAALELRPCDRLLRPVSNDTPMTPPRILFWLGRSQMCQGGRRDGICEQLGSRWMSTRTRVWAWWVVLAGISSVHTSRDLDLRSNGVLESGLHLPTKQSRNG